MSIDNLILTEEAVNLGIPTTTYIIKFFEIAGFLETHQPGKSQEWYHMQAAVRARNYFTAEKGETKNE